MKVWIRNLQKRIPLNSNELRRAVKTTLADLALPGSEVSISLVDDPQIQELNRQYLGRDKPTNVLAFSMREGEFAALNPQLLGDVVISVDTARRQSNRFGLKEREMIFLLMIHGILHLAGYDHERKRKESGVMARKQKELFRRVIEKVNPSTPQSEARGMPLGLGSGRRLRVDTERRQTRI